MAGQVLYAGLRGEQAGAGGLAEATTTKQEWLLNVLEHTIGQRHMAEIEPFEMLEAVRKYEGTSRTETARRAL